MINHVYLLSAFLFISSGFYKCSSYHFFKGSTKAHQNLNLRVYCETQTKPCSSLSNILIYDDILSNNVLSLVDDQASLGGLGHTVMNRNNPRTAVEKGNLNSFTYLEEKEKNVTTYYRFVIFTQ